MPNHIKNKLKIVGTSEQIKAVFDKYNTHVKANIRKAYDDTVICKKKVEEESFTVGWLNLENGVFKTRGDDSETIGLPEGWEIEISDAKDCFPDFEKIIAPPDCDEYKDLPNQQAVRNHPNWWSTWNRKFWGTKWNSYSHETESFGTYIFETAWSGVPILMCNLSKQNPEVEFEYTYADEDTGCNVGRYKFKAGKILESFVPENCSKEAYDLAFELRPYHKKYYELFDGDYISK